MVLKCRLVKLSTTVLEMEGTKAKSILFRISFILVFESCALCLTLVCGCSFILELWDRFFLFDSYINTLFHSGPEYFYGHTGEGPLPRTHGSLSSNSRSITSVASFSGGERQHPSSPSLYWRELYRLTRGCGTIPWSTYAGALLNFSLYNFLLYFETTLLRASSSVFHLTSIHANC